MRLDPQNVSEDCWYYEEPKGLCVVLYGKTNQGCLMATIPWKMIRGSLKRKDKKGTGTKRKAVQKPRTQKSSWDSFSYGKGFNFNGEECR